MSEVNEEASLINAFQWGFTTGEGSHAAQDNQEMKDFPGVSDFADGQGE